MLRMTRKTGKANSISVVLSERSESKDPYPPRLPKRVRILRRAFGLLRMTCKRTSPPSFLCHPERAAKQRSRRIRPPRLPYAAPTSNEPRLPLMRELSAKLTEGEIPTSIRTRRIPNCQLSIVNCQFSIPPAPHHILCFCTRISSPRKVSRVNSPYSLDAIWGEYRCPSSSTLRLVVMIIAFPAISR